MSDAGYSVRGWGFGERVVRLEPRYHVVARDSTATVRLYEALKEKASMSVS